MTATADRPAPLSLTDWPPGERHAVRVGDGEAVWRLADGGYQVVKDFDWAVVSESPLGELVGPAWAVLVVNRAWMVRDMGDAD